MSGRNERTGLFFADSWKLLLRLTVIGLTLYFAYHLRTIIITLLIGAIIAWVIEPIVEPLSRIPLFVKVHTAMGHVYSRGRLIGRMPRHTLRFFATFYVLVLSVILLWKGTELIVKPFSTQVKEVVAHQAEYKKMYEEKVPEDWRQKIEDTFQSDDVQKQIQENLLRFTSNLRYIVEIVLLPVLAFYFILDGHKLKKEFIVLAPRKYRREVLRMTGEFNSIMRDYMLGQFILCTLAGVVVGIGLAILHVKYAFIMGVLAGVTRAIPIVGPIIGGIPIIALTYVSDPVYGMHKAIGVLIFFTFLHFAESKFVMPKIIGDRMELHPVVIIVVLLVGGEVGNILLGGTVGALLGMFFAPPVAAIVRVMLRRYHLRLPAHLHHRPVLVAVPVSPPPAALPETRD